MKSAIDAALQVAEITPEISSLTPEELAGIEHFADKLHGGKLYLASHAGRAETARALSREIADALPLRRPHLLRQLKRVKSYLDIWSRDEPLSWEQIVDDRAQFVAHYLANHRAEAIERKRRLEPVRAWAREMLAKPDLLVLDSETTGLEGYLVEIGIIDRDGKQVFHSLVNPQCPIEAGAQEVHGISAADVKDAPTFAQIEPRLRELLQYKWIVIYNAEFDMDVLRREVERETRTQLEAAGVPNQLPPIETAPDSLLSLAYAQATWRGIAGTVADGWVRSVQSECAMNQWAIWCGDYSEYHGNYKWQRLNGGHRALEDCRACLGLLHQMAAPDENSTE